MDDFDNSGANSSEIYDVVSSKCSESEEISTASDVVQVRSPSRSEVKDASGSPVIKAQQITDFQKPRKSPKPSRDSEIRKVIASELDDGFSWRKYGEKSAKYPRSYYCCEFKRMDNCNAKKHVQVCDEDPTRYEVTYRGYHTCRKASSNLSFDSYGIPSDTLTVSEGNSELERGVDLEDMEKLSTQVKRPRLTSVPDQSKRDLLPRHVASAVITSTDAVNFREMVQHLTGASYLGQNSQLVQKEKSPVSCGDPTLFENFEVKDIKGTEHNTDISPMVVASDVHEEFEMLPESLRQLSLYCSLFPASCEFEKDTIIQLWIAGDFVENMNVEASEDAGNYCFNYLVEKKLIVASRFDHISGEFKYQINHELASVIREKRFRGEYLIAHDENLGDISEKLQHLSLVCDDINVVTLSALKRCHCLRTLFLFPGCCSLIKQVPRSLFLTLKFLWSLDMSGTSISELPSSIGCVTSLRYLDLSGAPIKWLPESLDNLCNLQTLKLKDCLHLVALPSGMSKLMNLRHLYLDNARRLTSFPARMGKLINLRTLSEFLVGRDYGYSIGELRTLRKLCGTVCILKLENVLNLEESVEAALSEKRNINRLDLCWSEPRDENVEKEEEALRCLQPHFQLEDLKIRHYGGLKFPDWITNPSFANLISITLVKCKNCLVLPSLGELPSLKYLYLYKINAVKEINCELCTRSQSSCAFPKLEVFSIFEMLSLRKWAVVHGGFPCLREVKIDCCPELVTIPLLCELQSLEHLEVINCPKLSFLCNDRVPSSLKLFVIRDCPTLKDLWHKEGGGDWHIGQIPSLWIDFQEMSMG